MIDVFRVRLSKDQFGRLPKDERAVLLLSGHALNQISVLMKLVIFSSNRDPTDAVEGRVCAGQTQIILRLLIGTLFEVWRFVKRPAYEEVIRVYLPLMNDTGRTAFSELTAHFDGSKLLRDLRNNVAFHFPWREHIEDAFAAIPADDDWEWYLSQANSNSFYFSSELILGYGMVNATLEPSPMKAFGIVMGEAMLVSNLMPDFFQALMQAILERHFGKDILSPEHATSIHNAPELREFWLPFFSEPSASEVP